MENIKIPKINCNDLKIDIEPVSFGRYLLSYETYPIETDSQLTVRLFTENAESLEDLNDNTQFELHFCGNEFQYAGYQNAIFGGSNRKSWRTYPPIPYNNDKKNRVDVFFDMQEGEVYHYLNNVLVREEILSPRIKKICGFRFSVEKGNIDTENIIFTSVDRSLTRKMDEIKMAYPESFKGSLNISTVESEDVFAFNYFTKTPTLEFKMVNEAKASVYSVNYRLVNEHGLAVWEKDESLSFETNESKNHRLEVKSDYYGVMTLIITAANSSSGEITTYKKHIALINAPKDGKLHPTLGFDLPDRPLHAKYYDKLINIAKKAGFSNLRWTFSNGYRAYDEDGRPITSEAEDLILKSIKDSGLLWNCVLHCGNKQWNDMPRDEETLAQWKEYCYQTALMTKDFPNEIVHEIWNEPNGSGFNPYGSIQDYANLIEASKEGVSRINSNAKIIGGSISGFGEPYIKQLLQCENGRIMDAASFHPYMWMQGPESGEQFPRLCGVRKILDENGLKGKPMWLTEIGWYTHVGIPKQAIYTIQMFLLNQINGNLAEKIQIFDLTDNDRLPRETFGLLNSVIDHDPFLARPAFLACANYAVLMRDSVFEETIEYSKKQNVYKFKLSDGRDMITFWTLEDSDQISLDLGTDEIEICDLYGNTQKQYGLDGKFQFDANIYPQYIIGNFNRLEKCPEIFNVNKDRLGVVNHDKAELSIENKSGKTLTLTTSASKNMIVPNKRELGNRTETLLFSANDISRAISKKTAKGGLVMTSDEVVKMVNEHAESISVRIGDGDKLYYKKNIGIECVPTAIVEHYVRYDPTEKWQFVVDITNNNYDRDIDGVINIFAPVSFSEKVSKFSTGIIKAGEMKKVSIKIPDTVDRNDKTFVGELVFGDGYTVDLSQELSFRGIPKVKTAPEIDGVLSEGEWPDEYTIRMDGENGVIHNLTGIPWSGNDDLSANVYMCYDDKNFYFAARVTDDINLEDKNKRMIASDGFMLAVSLERSSNAPYTELSFAMIDGKPIIKRESKLIAMGIGEDFPHKLSIVRNEEKKETVYELAVPFTEILPPDFDVRSHSIINISILLNDRDQNETINRDKMIEYGSGIGFFKDPSLYFDYNLIR